MLRSVSVMTIVLTARHIHTGSQVNSCVYRGRVFSTCHFARVSNINLNSNLTRKN